MRHVYLGLIVAACASSSHPQQEKALRTRPSSQEIGPARPFGQRLSRVDISIAPQQVFVDGYLASFAFYAQGPDGTGKLVWNQSADVYIQTLDAQLKARGKPTVLRGQTALALASVREGFVLALGEVHGDSLFNSFHTDIAVDIVHLRSDDKEMFRTRIVGGKGTGPAATWHSYSAGGAVRIAEHHGEIAVFAKISRNFAKSPDTPDTHQGDLFVVLDAEGRILAERTQEWTASHSNMQQLLVDNTGFVTLTVGDAYPYGVQLVHRTTRKQVILWPLESQRTDDIVERVRTVADAGMMCGAATLGASHFAVVGTQDPPRVGEEADNDVLLLRFAADGTAQQKFWLTRDAANDRCPYMARLGDQLLVGWRRDVSERKAMADLVIVSPAGEIVAGPLATDYPLQDFAGAGFFNYANGDVGWVHADYQAQSISLFRVAQR